MHGINLENNDVFIRRVLVRDGNSRCFINDQPVSLSFLKQVTSSLMEVHQQFDQVLDPAVHRSILDAYLNNSVLVREVEGAYSAWREAQTALQTYQQEIEKTEKDRAFLEHQVNELAAFSPKPNEEDILSEQRQFLKQKAAFVQTYELVVNTFEGEYKKEALSTLRALSKFDDVTSVGLTADIEAALSLMTDIGAKAHDHLREISLESSSLEDVENRLFELRQLARKYQALPNELHQVLMNSQERLDAFESSSFALTELEAKAKELKSVYEHKARELSTLRAAAANQLDLAVMSELPPLKLQHAMFKTLVEAQAETLWGASGLDRVEFLVDMNAQGALLPLQKVASGGEMARLMLSLKVSLARSGLMPGLVFDEVDSGVGGDVAHAVGQRLKRLASHVQVLVITHSPQVASAGDVHWCIEKTQLESGVETQSKELTQDERVHELARMLSGNVITPESIDAAKSLLMQH
jgi:DNA repair protein RecN (Recombination protein N)